MQSYGDAVREAEERESQVGYARLSADARCLLNVRRFDHEALSGGIDGFLTNTPPARVRDTIEDLRRIGSTSVPVLDWVVRSIGGLEVSEWEYARRLAAFLEQERLPAYEEEGAVIQRLMAALSLANEW